MGVGWYPYIDRYMEVVLIYDLVSVESPGPSLPSSLSICENSLGNPVITGGSLAVSGCENVPVVDQSPPTLPANLHRQ